MRKAALPAEAPADARLLILGSLPGDQSIRQQQYYAHPSNAFWWLVGEVVEEPLSLMPYPDRLAALRRHRIALWDVIAAAHRPGSLDAAIRDRDLRDLRAFVAALPDLATVAFNGAEAARHGRRQLGDAGAIRLIDLPSSSAAHAGLSRGAKRETWLRLREALIQTS